MDFTEQEMEMLIRRWEERRETYGRLFRKGSGPIIRKAVIDGILISPDNRALEGVLSRLGDEAVKAFLPTVFAANPK